MAADSLDVACQLLGCAVDVGPAYEPDDRPFIERFFGIVATRFTHRLPGTTGSKASDVLCLLKDQGNDLKSAKWLVWHGKGRKAVPRLQAVSDELEKWPSQKQSALWWNVRKACNYVRSHTRFLVNYGARSRKGLPISSSIAESAVNQVVSSRMAKKQQMRWSDEGRTSWHW